MHVGLGSLESAFKSASFNIKISSTRKHNTLQWHTLIVNTSRGPVFTKESLHSTQLTSCMLDEVSNQCEQTSHCEAILPSEK